MPVKYPREDCWSGAQIYKSRCQGMGLSWRCKSGSNWYRLDSDQQRSREETSRGLSHGALRVWELRIWGRISKEYWEAETREVGGNWESAETQHLSEASLASKEKGRYAAYGPGGSDEMRNVKWSLNGATGRSQVTLQQFCWNGGDRCHFRVCFREDGRTWIEDHEYRYHFWRYFCKEEQRNDKKRGKWGQEHFLVCLYFCNMHFICSDMKIIWSIPLWDFLAALCGSRVLAPWPGIEPGPSSESTKF